MTDPTTSVDEVIAAAADNEGPWSDIVSGGGAYTSDPDDALFIATFDPEHVALMEAVVKACGVTLGEVGNTTNWTRAIGQAREALIAYRKERGYR